MKPHPIAYLFLCASLAVPMAFADPQFPSDHGVTSASPEQPAEDLKFEQFSHFFLLCGDYCFLGPKVAWVTVWGGIDADQARRKVEADAKSFRLADADDYARPLGGYPPGAPAPNLAGLCLAVRYESVEVRRHVVRIAREASGTKGSESSKQPMVYLSPDLDAKQRKVPLREFLEIFEKKYCKGEPEGEQGGQGSPMNPKTPKAIERPN